jgi:hypothetical protein
MDKKTKTELVLSRHEQLLIRCYHKKVITFGGLTDRLEKMIDRYGIKKMVQLAK